MLSDELRPWSDARGWELPQEALTKLDTLLGLWLRYGAVMNLTGARTRAELLPQLLDGLDTAWVVRQAVPSIEDVRWLDFGSGGGFPGLVVAAVCSAEVMLCEPRQKRAGFLELALGAIGRKSVVVSRERFAHPTWVENPANGFIAAADAERRVVTARAVWNPDEWYGIGSHVVQTGGHVVMHLKEAELASKLGLNPVVQSERGTIGVATAE